MLRDAKPLVTKSVGIKETYQVKDLLLSLPREKIPFSSHILVGRGHLQLREFCFLSNSVAGCRQLTISRKMLLFQKISSLSSLISPQNKLPLRNLPWMYHTDAVNLIPLNHSFCIPLRTFWLFSVTPSKTSFVFVFPVSETGVKRFRQTSFWRKLFLQSCWPFKLSSTAIRVPSWLSVMLFWSFVVGISICANKKSARIHKVTQNCFSSA